MKVVANMYQISINILTTNIRGTREHQARWTHLVPDDRLRSFSTIQPGLLDMWLIHVDDSHFDLIIHKESFLAKEGSLHQKTDTTNEKEKDTENIIEDELKESDDENMGPGYMGWKRSEESEKPTLKMYEELKESFAELKVEYKELKAAYKDISKKINCGGVTEEDKETHFKKLQTEIRKLKEDYKLCMEAIKKETHERNKAETIVKVLKDTLEAQNKMKETDMEIDNNKQETVNESGPENNGSEDAPNKKKENDMEVDDSTEETDIVQEKGEWKHQTNKKKRKSSKDEHQIQNFQCGKKLESQENLAEHMQEHIQVKDNSELQCSKCDKVYSNMNKLRRHNWRNHREIDCNICGDKLASRSDISVHRQMKHQMFRRVQCKFYPDCVDEDECFFEHKDINNTGATENRNQQSFNCANGDSCSNQSCTYSEKNHINVENVLCKFQANCNRLSCMFKHNMERKAFLGVGRSNPTKR